MLASQHFSVRYHELNQKWPTIHVSISVDSNSIEQFQHGGVFCTKVGLPMLLKMLGLGSNCQTMHCTSVDSAMERNRKNKKQTS